MIGIMTHDGHLIALGQCSVFRPPFPFRHIIVPEPVLRQRVGATPGFERSKMRSPYSLLFISFLCLNKESHQTYIFLYLLQGTLLSDGNHEDVVAHVDAAEDTIVG